MCLGLGFRLLLTLQQLAHGACECMFIRKWKEVSSRGLFPVCLAFLELDASLVDSNVRCEH